MKKELISGVVCIIILLAMIHLGISALDLNAFAGCDVVSHEGNVLSIKLHPEFTTGTDGASEMAGRIVLNICQQGYKVRVLNWTVPGIIDLEHAAMLADGY